MSDVEFRKHYDDMRGMWQGRVLEFATGKMAHVLQSMLAHSYRPDIVKTLFAVVYPQFTRAPFPMCVTAGRIAVDGAIMARVARNEKELEAYTFGLISMCEWQVIFKSETKMTQEFRRIADAVKLTDRERIEMFRMVKAWIVCDYRAPVSGPELDERLAK
jgi:hypothetical protein